MPKLYIFIQKKQKNKNIVHVDEKEESKYDNSDKFF